MVVSTSTNVLILSIDGYEVGALRAGELPFVQRDGVTDTPSSNNVRLRHVGVAHIAPATLLCGAFSSSSMFRWLADTVQKKPVRRNLELKHFDTLRKTGYSAEMFDCLVAEIVLPALRRKSKDDAGVFVKIRPERIKTTVLGKNVRAPLSKPLSEWKAGDFELSVDGLPAASAAVESIEALTIKQITKDFFVGDSMLPEIVPTKLEEGNLVVTLPAAKADEATAWFETRGASAKRKGSLKYLSPKKTMILGVTFGDMIPMSVTKSNQSVRLEISCGTMTLDVPGG